jgi:hypothetical protein
MDGAHVDAGADVDVVGVCVVRAECVHGERRLTVTMSHDIRVPPGPAQHPVDAAEASRLVMDFLADPCAQPAAPSGRTGTT